jgi:hypothetical protein
MQSNRTRLVLAGMVVLSAGCESTPTSTDDMLATKATDLAVCSPGAGGFSTTSTNPYFPLQVGYVWDYAGDDDGELAELRITVLDETEVVGGVTTRVVEEKEWIDGNLIEVSRNFFAQASDGTVCYFGEDVDIFDEETGELISHEGAWRADEGENAPGIIMPADPEPGLKFVMEVAPGIAEDEGTVVGSGPVKIGETIYPNTIRIREFNPLDGDKGFKVFAAGVGLIIDGAVELISRNF